MRFQAVLVREPNNKYDRNAIAVLARGTRRGTGREVHKLDLPARRQIPRFHSTLRSPLYGADDAEKLRG